MDLSTIEGVLDIGGSRLNSKLGERLLRQLRDKTSSTLPDELLYNDKGLSIWNEIIWQPEYYQTHDEIRLFDEYGSEIAERVEDNVTLIDIGAGDTRKVEHLLAAFERAQKPATYLALDISKQSLDANVSYLQGRHSEPNSFVHCAGIWGTFENGREWVDRNVPGPRLFLSLGSVLCNDEFAPAVQHLKQWQKLVRKNDFLLVGMDGHTAEGDREKIEAAYHARPDLSQAFFLQGFETANELLGAQLFKREDWDFACKLELDGLMARHLVPFKANKDVAGEVSGIFIKPDQIFDWFDSHKYNEHNVLIMASKTGLVSERIFRLQDSQFRQYLLRTKDDRDPNEDDDSGVAGVS